MDAWEVRDYIPISLISYLYKIIARVLLEQLKKVLSTVTNYRSAFVVGRQIVDAWLIANEVAEVCFKKKKKGIVV